MVTYGKHKWNIDERERKAESERLKKRETESLKKGKSPVREKQGEALKDG